MVICLASAKLGNMISKGGVLNWRRSYGNDGKLRVWGLTGFGFSFFCFILLVPEAMFMFVFRGCFVVMVHI